MSSQRLPSTAAPTIDLRLVPRTFARWLVVMIAGLTLASVGVHVWRFTMNAGQQRWFLMLLDLNSEHSLPTYYQGTTILLAGVLLGVVSLLPRRAGEPPRYWWMLLAILFVALSMDELCELHETIGYAVQKRLHPTGYFRYAWVIPGILFVGTVGAVCLRFVLQLPLRTRISFIVAGAIYVGGAIGVEMVSAKYSELHGEQNLTYSLIADTEELGEMTGIGIFLVALAGYLGERSAELRVEFSSEQSQSDPEVLPLREKLRRVA